MATYTALHINTDRASDVQLFVLDWLQRVRGNAAVDVIPEGFPEAIYGNGFIIGTEPPTCLAVINEPEGWVTVHVNSFYTMSDLLQEASAAFSTMAVAVMAQSVSEAYDIRVFQNGQHLRTITFAGDTGEYHEEGVRLPFEPVPLGTNIAEPDEEPCYVFGRENALDYCKNLGLELPWGDSEGNGEYTVLTVRHARDPKPWWRFW